MFTGIAEGLFPIFPASVSISFDRAEMGLWCGSGSIKYNWSNGTGNDVTHKNNYNAEYRASVFSEKYMVIYDFRILVLPVELVWPQAWLLGNCSHLN